MKVTSSAGEVELAVARLIGGLAELTDPIDRSVDDGGGPSLGHKRNIGLRGTAAARTGSNSGAEQDDAQRPTTSRLEDIPRAR
jgi:hypothetical protein